MSQGQYSFLKELFHGHINENLLKRFPLFNTQREGDFSLMQDSIEEWLNTNVNSMKIEEHKKIPPDVLKSMKDLGLFGLIIPEAFGGSELSQTMYTRMLELLNSHDASVTLTVGAHSSIGLKGLYLFGTDEQKAKYMPKLASGEMIASFALTEPTAGSDAAAIKTRVVRQGDKYILNGSKLWITNGGMADFFTVFAKETINGEEKITALIVTRDMGGVSHGPEEQKLGIKASSTVEVYFKDTPVPVENVLGQPGEGFKIAMSILNQGRVGLAGGALGAMRSVFKESLTYTKNRKTFGQSIDQYGLVQNMLTQMAMNIYATETITYFTTSLVDEKNYDYSIEAAISKVVGTELAWENINLGMQIHGGNGYMVEYGIERKLRDGRIGLIFEGTNEILRLFIALTGIKDVANIYQKASKSIQSFQKIKDIDSLTDSLNSLGMLSEFAFKELKKSLTIPTYREIFHPSLKLEYRRLTHSVQELASQTSRMIRHYGKKLIDEQIQLARLANVAIDCYLIATILARLHTALQSNPNSSSLKEEVMLGKLIIRNARIRINQSLFALKHNRDHQVKEIAKHLSETGKYPFSLK